MASGFPASLQRNLSNLFDSGTMTGLSDRDLIERVSGQRAGVAEAAFEVLITRHGPMVLRVCRNVLSNPDDADDAFQATFLVLVKQREAISKLDSVASWLYGVAARVSARARVDAAKRGKNEAGAIRLAARSVDHPVTADELDQAFFGPIVQEEVRRLPEKYRSVILLCYWEGLTQEQAAAQLGCPIGTVRSRIARARDILRRRLTRRGLAPTAGVLAAALGESSTRAAVSLGSVPPVLVRSSVQVAMRVAAGQATAEVVSAGVATLVKHVSWSMMMMKYGIPAFSVLMTATIATGLVTGGQQSRDNKRAAAPVQGQRVLRPQARARTRAVQRVSPDYIVDPPDLLVVEVLEALPGRPISGERLVRPDGKISLGFYGEVYVAGQSLKEIKGNIVTYLRKFLSDEALGLDPKVKPEESDRVSVDVAAMNSKGIYVMGDFAAPGRLPFTGKDTVLDVVNYAGGLLRGPENTTVRLYRQDPAGVRSRTIPIDIKEVMLGDDVSTNYALEPGDRLVAGMKSVQAGEPATARTEEDRRSREAETIREQSRRDEATLRDLDNRLSRMERTLERILDKLEDRDH